MGPNLGVGGNSTIANLYIAACPKSVASGNSTEPAINLSSDLPSSLNLITLIRPQSNTFNGTCATTNDGTATGLLINNTSHVNIISPDMEGSLLYGIKLVNAAEVTVTEPFATGTNGIYVDSTSVLNTFYMTQQSNSIFIDPAVVNSNTVYGVAGTFPGATPYGEYAGTNASPPKSLAGTYNARIGYTANNGTTTSSAFLNYCASNALAISAQNGCSVGSDLYVGGLLVGQSNQATASGTVTLTPTSGSYYRLVMSGNLTVADNPQGNDVFWLQICQPAASGPFTVSGGGHMGFLASLAYPNSANSCYATQWVYNTVEAKAIMSGGPIYSNNGGLVPITVGAGCGTVASVNGGFSNGSSAVVSFTAGQTSCIPVITSNLTAPHGWDCSAHDVTTPADTLTQTASTTTSCTVSGTVAASDQILVRLTAF
jgi:hypothetical protein